MLSSTAKKITKENKETLEEHLLHFSNFIGAFRDGSSHYNSSFKHEKGSLTYENYRSRTIDTIADGMKEKSYYWPGKEERKDASNEIYQKCGFRNCLGFTDRTFFPLFFNPRHADSGDCCGRKSGRTSSFFLVIMTCAFFTLTQVALDQPMAISHGGVVKCLREKMNVLR